VIQRTVSQKRFITEYEYMQCIGTQDSEQESTGVPYGECILCIFLYLNVPVDIIPWEQPITATLLALK